MLKQDSQQEASVASSVKDKNLRRNRLILMVGAVIVLAFAITFATMTIQALQIRKANGSVFAQYVIDHHIGTAQIADDASGFQGDFCVLQLKQPIPPDQLEKQSLSLMRQYNTLDGGTTLNIVYQDPTTNKQVTEASLIYDDVAQVVHMTLLEGKIHVQKDATVKWTQTQQTGS